MDVMFETKLTKRSSGFSDWFTAFFINLFCASYIKRHV